MQGITMVDLAGQHAAIQLELDEAFRKVMASTAYIKGPFVADFEKELAAYLGCNHCIGVANGTDALQLALMALNLPAGSEVLVPDFTFVATSEVVCLLGLVPVLLPVDPDTFLLRPETISAALSAKTRAIIPVHLFGQCADMDAIMEIAQQHGLYVIEDTAQAIGAKYTHADGRVSRAGTIGHVGTTSFFPSKNLGCMGDGGAVMTNSPELARAVALFANHGMDAQYIYEKIGINSRLDGLQAAFLSVKLKRLDAYNEARKRAAAAYTAALSELPGLHTPAHVSNSEHIYHQYTLKVPAGIRAQLEKGLAAAGIPTKIYYPRLISSFPAYAAFGATPATSAKEMTGLCESVISLPMHTELDERQIQYITDTVISIYTSSQQA